MVERLLPSDDPVAEEVLEWTIKRDAQDIAQLMEWLVGTTARKDREMLINRVSLIVCVFPPSGTDCW